MNVVRLFENQERKESERFEALHCRNLGLSQLSETLGSADEWLGAALLHVKCVQQPIDAGTVTISSAALSLLVWKLEEALFNGTPWRPGIKFD